MPTLLTFEDAVSDARDRFGNLSVLLGNGFSIDYDPTVFSYNTLAAEAPFTALSVDKDDLFDALDSRNFEIVIEMLNAGAALNRLYSRSQRLGF